MAQHDYVISNGTGAAVRSDLNNALLAIVSQNSGATEPTTTYAYQWWADTTTGLLKIRNSANNAWITLRELDGTLTVEDGTVSAPGLAFRDDLNTGIWRPGTDQFAISTNGVERVEWGTSEVVFNDAGNNYDFRVEGDTNANLLFVDASADAVGIGSSSPVFLTDILSGTANTGANVNNPSQLSVTGPNKSLTGGGATVFINSNTDLAVDTGGSIALSGRNTTSSTNSVVWSVVKGAKENATSGNTAGYLAFASANHAVGGLVEAMRIDSSQRVGIGSTSPQNLFVISNGGANGLEFNPATESGTANYVISYNRTAAAYRDLRFAAAATRFEIGETEAVRIDSSRRLLVGTSSESAYSRAIFAGRSDGNAAGLVKLQSTNSAPASGDTLGNLLYGVTGATTTQAVAEIYAARDGGTWTNNSSMPGRLVFATTSDSASSSTERARITSSGFFKAKADTVYQSETGSYHEFNSNTSSSPVLNVLNKNTSYTNAVLNGGADRAANSAYDFQNWYSAYSGTFDLEFRLRGDGNGLCDGAWTGGGADYAEYFEWSDSNPDAEDRRGISVVLDGNKIREAQAGEDPIGVISGNPSVVGDAAWNKWSGKYLRDEFDAYLLDENGDRQLNPAYDPDQEYIPREQRPEWDCVGLMGKLRIRKGQVTGSRWIKMRDISDAVEEWLVR